MQSQAEITSSKVLEKNLRPLLRKQKAQSTKTAAKGSFPLCFATNKETDAKVASETKHNRTAQCRKTKEVS